MCKEWIRRMNNLDNLSDNQMLKIVLQQEEKYIRKFIQNMINLEEWSVVKLFVKLTIKTKKELFDNVFFNYYSNHIELVKILYKFK